MSPIVGTDRTKRPMEGLYLRDTLKRLAEITAIATSLKFDLEPLSDEDVAAGAKPLSLAQIREELEAICRLATSIALEDIQATSEEWYAANDTIE